LSHGAVCWNYSVRFLRTTAYNTLILEAVGLYRSAERCLKWSYAAYYSN